MMLSKIIQTFPRTIDFSSFCVGSIPRCCVIANCQCIFTVRTYRWFYDFTHFYI